MFKYSREGVSVFAVLDRRRAKTNGLYPVKIEVVEHRRQKYYPAGVDMSQKDWDRIFSGEGDVTCRRLVEDRLFSVISEVSRLIGLGGFSFYALDIRLGRQGACSLNSILAQLAEEFRRGNRANTYYRYRSTLHGVEAYAGKAVALSSITVEWLRGCERFWLSSGKKLTTVSIYMKGIKRVFTKAVSDGLIDEYSSPFRRNGYRIPRASGRKLALSVEQIKKIIEFHGDPGLEKWRDMWLFSYLCNGINFRDMLYLRYANIVDGEIWFTRSKTRNSASARTVKAPLTGEMLRIIDNIGNPFRGDPNEFIFKFAVEAEDDFEITLNVRKVVARCNHALACIARELDIPRFTTYSARHSFASILQRKGVDITYISECLGHTNVLITQHYLAGFDKEDRIRNAALLTDFEMRERI